MEKLHFLLLFPFLISCKKDNEVKALKKEIVGTWELEKSVGYPNIIFPAGNGRIMVIDEDGTFERKQHDTLVFKGHYMIQKKADCLDRPSDVAFSTNERPSSEYRYIDVIDGKLTLSSSNCALDGATAYYRRL